VGQSTNKELMANSKRYSKYLSRSGIRNILGKGIGNPSGFEIWGLVGLKILCQCSCKRNLFVSGICTLREKGKRKKANERFIISNIGSLVEMVLKF
jgi:hypothetical protein